MSQTTSAGHALSGAGWLDLHAEMAKAEYANAIASLPIPTGGRVLDAGCGAGAFLPALVAAVGKAGTVAAIDVAPEHVEAIVRKRSEGLLPRSLDVRVANVTLLPFEDGVFDVVWSANVVQYLTPGGFDTAVIEAMRVLKPGGVLAIKDYDVSMLQMAPLDDRRFFRLLDARMAAFEARGILGTRCGPTIPGRLRALRFPPFDRRGWMVERWAPLDAPSRAFVAGFLMVLCDAAFTYPLSAADQAYWRDIRHNTDSILDDPDFRFREGFVVTLARKSDSP